MHTSLNYSFCFEEVLTTGLYYIIITLDDLQCQQDVAFALPHTLAVHNFKTLTVCKVCDKMLIGLMKQGLRCRDCKVLLFIN